VCDLPVYLDGESVHPCCAQSRKRGEAFCFGCEAFKRREQKRGKR
jgi:hypothetical protein